MRQGICNGTVSVRLSNVAAACGGSATVGPAGRRYRSTAALQQLRAVSHRKLNFLFSDFTHILKSVKGI